MKLNPFIILTHQDTITGNNVIETSRKRIDHFAAIGDYNSFKQIMYIHQPTKFTLNIAINNSNYEIVDLITTYFPKIKPRNEEKMKALLFLNKLLKRSGTFIAN
jgi:hypothetical protein